MNDSLEWRLRKLGEATDVLSRAVRDNREYGVRKIGVPYSALGRFSIWPWMN